MKYEIIQTKPYPLAEYEIQSKADKRQKDNIRFIIAGKNTAKSFESAKEPLDLIALFVQLRIMILRIFAVAF